jgi:O-antigen/teichoic acid export membrane protein
MLFAGLTVLILKINFNKLSIINERIKVITAVILFLLTTAYLIIVPHCAKSLALFSIDNWLNSFINGTFPFNSPSSAIGFPFFYFSVLPFYLIGITNLIALAGIAILLFVIVKISKSNSEFFLQISLLAILLLLSIVFNVGLESLLNVGLALLVFYFIENKELHNPSNKIIFTLAIFFGLLLSTHLISTFIIFIYFIFYLRNNFSALAKMFFLSILVFLLTLLPFLIWDFEAFLNNNPFLWQMELLNISSWSLIFFLAAAIICGWMISDLQEYFFVTGVIIFMIVLTCYFLSVFKFGLLEASQNGSLNLTYLVYSIPFLILSIKEYKVDRFLGKVLGEDWRK